MNQLNQLIIFPNANINFVFRNIITKPISLFDSIYKSSNIDGLRILIYSIQELIIIEFTNIHVLLL